MFTVDVRLADMHCMKLALAALAAFVLFAVPAGASSGTRSCGNITVGLGHGFEGGAWKIRATRVSCDRARSVAQSCVRGHRSGWLSANGVDHARTTLERDRARVSFEIAGGGGCA